MLNRPIFALILMLGSALSVAAEGAQRYRLTLHYAWSAASHPVDFPADAHMAGLFGVTHDARYVLFRDGNTASSGVILMAENGRNTVLLAEWSEAARRKRVGVVFEAPGTSTQPGSVVVEFDALPEFPFVSFAAMIAPSPDWFTGAASVALRDGAVWRDRITVPLWAWDAGSAGGESYTADRVDMQPRQSVRLLAGPQFLDQDGLRSMGQAVLTRLP